MLGLLFLLLPIAVGYGWYMGQRSARQSYQHQAMQVSKQYVQGLDLLLSDQSDKALDHFIELLQVDSDAIDTHFALGNLFRQRGEVDRAIRIHENLIQKESIGLEYRSLAQQQLAQDYLAAGMFDRAEDLLLALLDEPTQRVTALKSLLQIYQQTKEWVKAVKIANKLHPSDLSDVKKHLAHFYCEQAKQIKDVDEKTKQKLLIKALNADPDCVRASLMLADVFIEKNDDKQALKVLSRVPEQDVEMIGEMLSRYEQCCERLNAQKHYQEFLEYCCVNLRIGTSVMLALARLYEKTQGVESALQFIESQLKRNPTIRGFRQLMQYHSQLLQSTNAKRTLETLGELVDLQLTQKASYQCQRCGFSSHIVYWQCPSCKNWGSIKPIRGLDGE